MPVPQKTDSILSICTNEPREAQLRAFRCVADKKCYWAGSAGKCVTGAQHNRQLVDGSGGCDRTGAGIAKHANRTAGDVRGNGS
eukprot:1361356-Pyramimonas_sp.AAC.1